MIRAGRGAWRARIGSAVCLALLWGLALPAQATDLLQIYRMAQRNDPTFQAARHAFVAALQAIPQARAGLLPNVGLEGSDGLTRASTAFSDLAPVDRRIHTCTWTRRLAQPVFNLEKFDAYRQSRFAVQRARAQLAQAQADLILRVARAYFNVLVAQEEVTAAQAQVSATRQQLGQAQRGYRAGTAAVTDVYEAKARLALARSQAVAAANDLEDRRAELQKITNAWPATLAALKSTAVIPVPLPDEPSAWMRQARERNPAVQAQQAALSEATAAISRARAGYLPTVDLVASYGDNYSSGNLTNPVNYSTRYRSGEVDLRVVMPLYAGGATQSKVAEAVAKREQAASALEAARRRAATEARQAFAGIKNGLAQIAALQSSLRSGESAVTGNEVGYRLGLRINLDVLNAQEQMYVTLRDLAKARYDTLLQGLKLKAAAGSLSEADLVTLNALLAGGEGRTRRAHGG